MTAEELRQLLKDIAAGTLAVSADQIGIADVTTLNRALLPLTCALCYFLALIVDPDIRRLLAVSSAVPPQPGTR